MVTAVSHDEAPAPASHWSRRVKFGRACSSSSRDPSRSRGREDWGTSSRSSRRNRATSLPRSASSPAVLRGDGLSATMSRYLIDRIEATPNIEVLTRTEIVALIGRPGAYLERVRWRRRGTSEESERPIPNVFLFAGADPATEFCAAAA